MRIVLYLLLCGFGLGLSQTEKKSFDTSEDNYQFPWLVSVYIDGEFYCTGVVITPIWVLVSAHLVEMSAQGKTQPLTVKGGSSRTFPEGETYNVIQRIMHPQYQPFPGYYNVGLLKLNAPFNETVASPAKLAPEDLEIPDGTNLTVLDWDCNSMFSPVDLNQNSLTVINFDQCKSDYEPILGIHEDNMFCAGVDDEEVCTGCYGHPAVIDGVVVGTGNLIVCTDHRYPKAFNKISLCRPWIKELTGV